MDIIPQIIMNTIIAGAIYTLIALGFNLIYWVTKFFNIAHGAFLVLGGYILLFLYTQSGYNLYLSSVLTVVCVGTMGWLTDKTVFLQLRKRGASSVTMLVASLGIMSMLQALITIVFGTEYYRLLGSSAISETVKVFNAYITDVQIGIIATGFIIMLLLMTLINTTKFGKAVKAIGDDEEVSKIIGIDTDRIIGQVFFIGSAIAGLGGIMIGFDIGVTPAMGMAILLKGITACIVGGVGNLYGGILGAYLLGLVENTGVYLTSGAWSNAIAFGLLIIFLIFKPRGILGT